jgi:hypothetical protein
VMHLLNDKEECKRRITASQEYVQKYKGTNIAEQIFQLYKSIHNA